MVGAQVPRLALLVDPDQDYGCAEHVISQN